MFDNKWKERCEELETLLKNNEAVWNEATKDDSSLHIVKLIPECSNQFELDGEFVFDDADANYKAHTLTISEMVLFKAGRETARREFEEKEYACKKQLEDSEARVCFMENKLKDTEEYYNNLKQQSLQTLKDLSSTIQTQNLKIVELESQISKKENQISDLCQVHQKELDEKQSEVDYLNSTKSMEFTNLSGMKTPWGCIL